jgi:hypothetical protein
VVEMTRMHLRITTPEPDSHRFISGAVASIFLDGVDISPYTNRVVLTVATNEPVTAEITLYLEGIDVDVAAGIRALAAEDEPVVDEKPA